MVVIIKGILTERPHSFIYQTGSVNYGKEERRQDTYNKECMYINNQKLLVRRKNYFRTYKNQMFSSIFIIQGHPWPFFPLLDYIIGNLLINFKKSVIASIYKLLYNVTIRSIN